jgi:kinesin family member C1
VRPVLPSDLSSDDLPQKVADVDRVKAEITYPDKLDHKEIVLRSCSESATGQERKDEWAFTFDRVTHFVQTFLS